MLSEREIVSVCYTTKGGATKALARWTGPAALLLTVEVAGRVRYTLRTSTGYVQGRGRSFGFEEFCSSVRRLGGNVGEKFEGRPLRCDRSVADGTFAAPRCERDDGHEGPCTAPPLPPLPAGLPVGSLPPGVVPPPEVAVTLTPRPPTPGSIVPIWRRWRRREAECVGDLKCRLADLARAALPTIAALETIPPTPIEERHAALEEFLEGIVDAVCEALGRPAQRLIDVSPAGAVESHGETRRTFEEAIGEAVGLTPAQAAAWQRERRARREQRKVERGPRGGGGMERRKRPVEVQAERDGGLPGALGKFVPVVYGGSVVIHLAPVEAYESALCAYGGRSERHEATIAPRAVRRVCGDCAEIAQERGKS